MTLPSLDMEPNNVQIKDGIQDLSDKQSSKLDEMDDYELVPKPLDGGYGWIIVLTASLSCFISLVGLCRVLAGRIGDIKCVNRNVLAAAAVIYSGSISLVSIIFKSFTPMVVFSVMFGVGSGFYTGLIGACIYDVVGIQDISLGYLIFHIASGISSGVTMPIAGYLYDATKSPVATVVTFGAVQITGGLFLLSIPFIQARLKRIDNSSADSNTSC